MRETPSGGVDRSKVEYVDTQHWRYKRTDYVLGYIPDGPCAECGGEIADDEAGYIRDGPLADSGLDEVCFWCGNEVTGFAD
jgi:hypothetical protein